MYVMMMTTQPTVEKGEPRPSASFWGTLKSNYFRSILGWKLEKNEEEEEKHRRRPICP
jgi:hypothetical protein